MLKVDGAQQLHLLCVSQPEKCIMGRAMIQVRCSFFWNCAMISFFNIITDHKYKLYIIELYYFGGFGSPDII